MKLELVNPFIASSFQVLGSLLSETPAKGDLRLQRSGATADQVNVCLGVTGDVTGHLIFGMSLQTADKIASIMIGEPVKTFDRLAASAIGELANMIAGNGLRNLSEAGLECDITPPTVIRGQHVEISTLAIPALIVPLVLPSGEITLTIGLRQRK